MAQRPFGNQGTRTKLKTIFDYANFYTTALKDQPFRLHYLDAFAGTGAIPLKEEAPLLTGIMDTSEVLEGSARRILSINHPFDRYVFSDIKRTNADELELLRKEFPRLASRIEVMKGNANDVVHDFCVRLGANDRALVFLDPFGNQVDWSTLVKIAETGKVDLWYLFPAWLGVVRQVRNSGEILRDAEASIDAMFGPHNWRAKAVAPEENMQGDMFEVNSRPDRKIATADSITRFMIECMSGIFRGGVSEKWLPLGRDGRHFYSLLFACSNPHPKARGLAQRVAREIMTRK
jgi:three-Cys-motif partner protein